jgi:hypothetical protein
MAGDFAMVRTIVGLTAVIAAALAAGPVGADDTAPGGPPNDYPTPLTQTTQPSYVPQSVAMSGPRVITDWEEGEPIPAGYHPSRRIRRGLVIGGAVSFGVLYMLSTLVAAAGQDSNPHSGNPAAAMWAPGIGPFIQMASTSTATSNVLLAIDGLGQSAGLTMLIFGLASPRTVLLRNDLGLHVAPTLMPVGRNGGGLGLVGTF